MSCVRRNHPRCRSATWICEIRSGVSEPLWVEICPFSLLWLLAFTTASIQAVLLNFCLSAVLMFILMLQVRSVCVCSRTFDLDIINKQQAAEN